MKTVFNNIFKKFLNKAVNKAVSDNSGEMPEAEPTVPSAAPAGDSRKALWKFIIQTLINILAAVLTALGATSCVSHL